jgi:Fe-S-cluster-containing dehydrogenase component
MPRWGMVIDLDKCFACQSCTAACRMENNTPPAGPDQTERGRAILWNEVLAFVHGEYPKVEVLLVPRPCQHCDNPPCVRVCPVKATYKNEEGIVLVDYERCIGCRMCTVACPYQVRYFNWHRPEWPEALKAHLNPAADRRGGKVHLLHPTAAPGARKGRRGGPRLRRQRLSAGVRANVHRPRALLRRPGRSEQPGLRAIP